MGRDGRIGLRGARERNREKAMFLTTEALKAQFEANLARSNRVDIATAWATDGPALELLCKTAEVGGVRIRAIVGTYGNATHPRALERLSEIGTLRLAEGEQAMFHPKVYIFQGTAGSCAWIGSANFTGAGFARNEEVVHETDDVADAAAWFAASLEGVRCAGAGRNRRVRKAASQPGRMERASGIGRTRECGNEEATCIASRRGWVEGVCDGARSVQRILARRGIWMVGAWGDTQLRAYDLEGRDCRSVGTVGRFGGGTRGNVAGIA